MPVSTPPTSKKSDTQYQVTSSGFECFYTYLVLGSLVATATQEGSRQRGAKTMPVEKEECWDLFGRKYYSYQTPELPAAKPYCLGMTTFPGIR